MMTSEIGPEPAATALTIDGLLREATRRLSEAGVDGARSEARWLLGRTLGLTDAALLVRGAQPASPDDADRFRAVIARRAAREPFAYVVGQREFYGRTFTVNRHVLVPRPETETLVEEALRVLASPLTDRPLVVDIGAGSGAIGCTVALEAPSADVLACDVSAEALKVAAVNRDTLGLKGRLRLVRGSLLTWLGRPADLVLANLPYLPTGRLPDLMPEVRDWEPHLALDGGADGLDLIAALLADAHRTVRPGGTILLELDPEQVAPTAALLPDARATVIRDLAGLDRVLRLDLP